MTLLREVVVPPYALQLLVYAEYEGPSNCGSLQKLWDVYNKCGAERFVDLETLLRQNTDTCYRHQQRTRPHTGPHGYYLPAELVVDLYRQDEELFLIEHPPLDHPW